MKHKAVILHSGGLDSTVCILMAQKQGLDIVSLGIDYGQTHRVELDYAERQCQEFGVRRKVLHIQWDKPTRKIPIDRKIEEIRSGVSSAFLPGRNAIFLMLACAEASGLGAQEVWTGINSVDFSGYPDCRQEFVEAFSQMLKEAFIDPPKVIAPLMNWSKPRIAEEGLKLGLHKGDTWSCYRPLKTGNAFKECNRCDACKLHNYAWESVQKQS